MRQKFTIEVEMEERWIPHFMGMLKSTERLGKMGSSRTVSLFSEGDGDFRPTFKTDIDYVEAEPSKGDFGYDAG